MYDNCDLNPAEQTTRRTSSSTVPDFTIIKYATPFLILELFSFGSSPFRFFLLLLSVPKDRHWVNIIQLQESKSSKLETKTPDIIYLTVSNHCLSMSRNWPGPLIDVYEIKAYLLSMKSKIPLLESWRSLCPSLFGSRALPLLLKSPSSWWWDTILVSKKRQRVFQFSKINPERKE